MLEVPYTQLMKEGVDLVLVNVTEKLLLIVKGNRVYPWSWPVKDDHLTRALDRLDKYANMDYSYYREEFSMPGWTILFNSKEERWSTKTS